MSGPPFISEMVLNLVNKTMNRWEGKLGGSYTLDEIARHNTPNDFWIIVRGKVYDLTDYLMLHPGGPKLLFKNGGKDATEDFEGMFHSRNAKAILEKFWIGKVVQQPGLSTTTTSSSSLLSPNSFKIPTSRVPPRQQTPPSNTTRSIEESKKVEKSSSSSSSQPSIILSKVKIHKKIKHTGNTYFYQIELPDQHLHLNWISPLSHVSLSKHQHSTIQDDSNSNESNTNYEFKSYTPIKQSQDKKYLEFLIKGYDSGNVSKHIHQLKEGDYLSLRGPIETSDKFNFNNYQNDYLLMVAGGTGITPMIQIIYETFYGKNKVNDKLKFILIYASNNQDEIIYKKELDQIKSEFSDRIFIHYVVSQVKDDAIEPFNQSLMKKGRINQDLILTCLEPIIIKIIPKMITDAMDVLVCGPIEFNQFQNNELLKIGFKSNQIHLLQ